VNSGEFFAELGALRAQGWFPVVEDGRYLRLVQVDDQPDRYCPIAAVYKQRGGTLLERHMYWQAANGLGLDSLAADAIALAADAWDFPHIPYHEELLEAVRGGEG